MKSYLMESLSSNEKIIYSAKVTPWLIYFLIMELVTVFIVFYFASSVELLIAGITLQTPIGSIRVSFLLILFLMSALRMISKTINTVIFVLTTEIAITNLRVIYKTGLIRRDTLETRVKRIEGANISQSIAGRILGYGDILVTGTGTNLLNIASIDDPVFFRKELLKTIPE